MSGTIFALSTAPGRAAIAVVRISGERVRDVLLALCPPLPEPRRAVLRRLQDPSTDILLDEALVLYFAAPRSETGEDMAELHLHGGRAVIRSVLQTLADFPGCRVAEPGEFVRRAFANGKLGLAEVEGLADLIDAETESQRRQAMAIATGAQSKRFEHWRELILSALALVEAGIDFTDEADVSDQAARQAETTVRSLVADLKSHLADGHRGEILRDGFRVVLAGAPNAGKSSLLNALAHRDAAIVSEEAGTTRDIIEVRLDLEGLAVIVQDTAGVRETSSSIEQEGIRRTLLAARDADLVLWLQPVVDAEHRGSRSAEHRASGSAEHRGSRSAEHRASGSAEHRESASAEDRGSRSAEHREPVSAEDREPPGGAAVHPIPGENLIRILTKSDLVSCRPIHVKHPGQARVGGTGDPSPAWAEGQRPNRDADSPETCHLAVSAHTGAGLDDLTRLITQRARQATGDPSDPVITQARHRQALSDAVVHLEAFLAGSAAPVELRAEELRLASRALGRLTGRIDVEDVLGAIFSRFCIGK